MKTDRYPHLELLAATVLVVTWGVAQPVQAQVLAPGTRIRVTNDEAQTIGLLEDTTADSLVLTLAEADRIGFSWAGIGLVEHSLGRRGRPGRGALIGAATTTAFTVGAIVFANSEDELEDDIGDIVLILALPLNAALGAGIGALIGLAWRTERWAVIPHGSGVVGSSHAMSFTFRF